MQEKILVVDDEVALTTTLRSMLQAADYVPLIAHTAEDGLRLALVEQPDLVLLDVMIPTMGGWEVCQRLRQHSDVPIIFLTALGNVENVVYGLELGADDYIVKPFKQAEIVARIKAHLRRTQKPASAAQRELSFGEGVLRIDLPARQVTLDGRTVDLTPREFDLLAALATNAGRVLTTAELVRQAWGMEDPGAAENVKPYIHYLRKKIEADIAAPKWIVTVRGIGYRFFNE